MIDLDSRIYTTLPPGWDMQPFMQDPRMFLLFNEKGRPITEGMVDSLIPIEQHRKYAWYCYLVPARENPNFLEWSRSASESASRPKLPRTPR